MSTAAASPASTPPGTTATAWGRIWDSVPGSFPRYPGAEPTSTGGGAASAVLDVPASVSVAADWYRQRLEAVGYDTEALGGPLEDGSIVIASVGRDPDCRIQTSLVPRGTRTFATIMFAAACPFR